MTYGFINGKIVSAEEYLIDLELRIGQSTNIKHDLLNMPIKFDDTKIDAFIIGVKDDKPVIQLILPLSDKFDDKSNVYKTSYIRKLLNSNDFLNRFNQEFVERIQLTEVNTTNYVTYDKLWLLSHEEIAQNVDFLEQNKKCHAFDLFKHTDIKRYTQTLLELNKQQCYGWRLRSARSYTARGNYNSWVGSVNDCGYVIGSYVNTTYNGWILPVCAIC